MTLLLKLAKISSYGYMQLQSRWGNVIFIWDGQGPPKNCGIYYYGRRERKCNFMGLPTYLSHNSSELNCPVEEKVTFL